MLPCLCSIMKRRPSDALDVVQENIADKLGDGLHKVGDAAKNVKHKK